MNQPPPYAPGPPQGAPQYPGQASPAQPQYPPQGQPQGYPPQQPQYPPQGQPQGYPPQQPAYPPTVPPNGAPQGQGLPPGVSFVGPPPHYALQSTPYQHGPGQQPQGAPPAYPPQGQGYPPQQGYAQPPAQGYHQPPAQTAVPADPHALFAGADAQAKATFSRTYLNSEPATGPDGKPTTVPSVGDYVLELTGFEAINIPAIPGNQGYSGPACSLTFTVHQSTNPAHPAGAERSMFLKMETKRVQNSLNTLRNLVVSLFGWDESRNAAEIAGWLGSDPQVLQKCLVAMASDKATIGGLKGRYVQANAVARIAKTTGNNYARVTFRPTA